MKIVHTKDEQSLYLNYLLAEAFAVLKFLVAASSWMERNQQRRQRRSLE
ncbi:hypothetical protein QUA54_20760 [Microcoleus sp. MOSTC5]